MPIIPDRKELDAERWQCFAAERAALTTGKLAFLDRIARKLESASQQVEAGIADGTYSTLALALGARYQVAS
jgi:hypothetical protein